MLSSTPTAAGNCRKVTRWLPSHPTYMMPNTVTAMWSSDRAISLRKTSRIMMASRPAGQDERHGQALPPGIDADGQGTEIAQGLEGLVPLGLHQLVKLAQSQKNDQRNQEQKENPTTQGDHE